MPEIHLDTPATSTDIVSTLFGETTDNKPRAFPLEALGLFPNASSWGVVYDTSVDSSVTAQAAIDANKGGTIVFSHDFSARDVKLDDSSYDGTTVIMNGRIHFPGDGAANTPGLTIPAAFFVGTADGVTLYFKGHGERLGKIVKEQISLLMLAGATNLRVPTFDVIECRGDGCYISHLGSGALGDICDGVHFGEYRTVNSAIDGRNGLSIIAGRNIVIDDFYCRNFGHLLGGGSMPGGLDIEPNDPYELVDNVTIGKAHIVGVGQAPFAVHGHTALTSNVTCMNLYVENIAAPDVVDQLTNTTQSATPLVKIVNAKGVNVKGRAQWTNSYGIGLTSTGLQDCNIELNVTRVYIAAFLGGLPTYGGVSNNDNCTFNITADDVSRYGVVNGASTNCRIQGYVRDPKDAYYTNRFAVLTDPGVQTNVRYSVEVAYDTLWTRAYRHNGATYTNCRMHDIDLSAFTTVNNRIDDTIMMRENVGGVTDGTVQPNDGSWVQGQLVDDTASAVSANGNIRKGWTRLTTGGANVAGTDWEVVYEITADTPLLLTGTGTPEGAVVAGVGRMFTRTDGGAGTTLYVKETGTGNTGWVAK